MRAARTRLLNGSFAVAVHVIGPGEIQVPGNNFPLVRLGIVVIKVIFAVADVVMMNGFDNRAVTVILLQIEIVAPPLIGGRGGVVGIKEGGQVGSIGGLGRPLIVRRAGAAFHFVEIAVGQVVLVEEVAVELLDGTGTCLGNRRCIDSARFRWRFPQCGIAQNSCC